MDKKVIGWEEYNRQQGHTIWRDLDADYYSPVTVPEVGMIRCGMALLYEDDHAFIYEPCPGCQKTRWVRMDRSGILCKSCVQKKVNRDA